MHYQESWLIFEKKKIKCKTWLNVLIRSRQFPQYANDFIEFLWVLPIYLLPYGFTITNLQEPKCLISLYALIKLQWFWMQSPKFFDWKLLNPSQCSFFVRWTWLLIKDMQLLNLPCWLVGLSDSPSKSWFLRFSTPAHPLATEGECILPCFHQEIIWLS